MVHGERSSLSPDDDLLAPQLTHAKLFQSSMANYGQIVLFCGVYPLDPHDSLHWHDVGAAPVYIEQHIRSHIAGLSHLICHWRPSLRPL